MLCDEVGNNKFYLPNIRYDKLTERIALRIVPIFPLFSLPWPARKADNLTAICEIFRIWWHQEAWTYDSNDWLLIFVTPGWKPSSARVSSASRCEISVRTACQWELCCSYYDAAIFFIFSNQWTVVRNFLWPSKFRILQLSYKGRTSHLVTENTPCFDFMSAAYSAFLN
jgi:hypothetical protein